MENPKYDDYMLPILKYLKDKENVKVEEVSNHLVNEFNLTEELKNEYLPSGKQLVYKNRIGWAKTYLKKAELIDTPSRGIVNITKRGLEVLNSNLEKLDCKYLMKFNEFKQFQGLKNDDPTEFDITKPNNDTPQEELEKSYKVLRDSLAQELLDTILGKSPDFFERLVVELLVKMGYGGTIEEAGKAVGKTGDEGIDGIIKEDRLGLDQIYIQAKRWSRDNTIGRPEVQKFVGALAGQGAKKGIFITTSSFSKAAIEFTPKNDTKVVLIDGTLLTELMIDYNIGVSTTAVYEIKEIDGDYFEVD